MTMLEKTNTGCLIPATDDEIGEGAETGCPDAEPEQDNPDGGSREEPGKERIARNRELLRAAQQGDEGATETLITENMGLVRRVASRFLDRGTEYEDLIQIGTLGMLRAVRSFDLERGTAFSTYAVPLIIGEIRRHLRDDGIIRVSRTYKRTGAILMRERAKILSEEGREPGIAELAARAGVSTEDAAIALDALTPVTMLSETVYGEESGMTLEGTVTDGEENEMERICDRVALSQAIGKMQPLWQKIVLLRYYRDMTQQEVADNLGLSQVKVSREEKKIMAFLRAELA